MDAYCYVFAALIGLVAVTWIYYLISNNPSAIDGVWPIGIMSAGLIYLVLIPKQQTYLTLLSAGLLIAWASRLSAYMFKARISKKHIDKRYLELSKNWKINPKIGFLFNYILQAVLMFAVSISFYFIAQREPQSVSMFDYILLIIALISFILEATADRQLTQFKKQHQGKVCNIGLWKISRHPNYFFDFLFWLSFALIALPAPYGIIGMISPIAMLWIFLYISIPLTEKLSLESRGEAYEAYQKRVAIFVPFMLKFK